MVRNEHGQYEDQSCQAGARDCQIVRVRCQQGASGTDVFATFSQDGDADVAADQVCALVMGQGASATVYPNFHHLPPQDEQAPITHAAQMGFQ